MQQYHVDTAAPNAPSSTITLIEAGISDTLLGNQARAGYGGVNERLRSAVCCCLPPLFLQNAAQLPQGAVPRKLSSPDPARNLVKILGRV